MSDLDKFFDGTYSSYRLMMLLTILTFTTVWAGLSVTKGELLDFPNSLVYIIGIILGGKIAQNYTEKLQPTNPFSKDISS